MICDDVLISSKNKHFLQGIVGAIVVRKLPVIIGGLVAYVRLSNVYPAQKVALAFERASTDEEMFRFEADLPQQSDPTGVYTIVLPISPFEVRESGKYIFSAKHNGIPFAQSPILIQGPEVQE